MLKIFQQIFKIKKNKINNININQFLNKKSLLKNLPLVSIIILTYNNLKLTQACLNSIEKYTDYENLEIIIIDNASQDGTPEYLKKNYLHKKNYKIILNQKNTGFAAGNNIGLNLAQGDYIVILNNDTQVTPYWLANMLYHFENHSNIGLLGPVTNNIGNEAKVFTRYKNPDKMLPEVLEITNKNNNQLRELKTAAFFCVMFKKELYLQVGDLDENYNLGYFEDDDYCRRVEKLGYKIYCAEDVFIHHYLSASFKKLSFIKRKNLFNQNKKYYESKWGKWQKHEYR